MGKRWLQLEYLLLFSVFIIATCGLVYELTAGALASYLLGDSVRQFSFIIGIYLFSMGVGSYLAKFLNGNLLHHFVIIEIWVGLVGGLSSVILFWVFDYGASFKIILYLLVFVTGCLVGLEIPLLMRLLQDRVQFKDLVSNVFAVDYVGALLASLLFPLVLVPSLGLMRTSLFFGLINVGIAIALCFLAQRELQGARGLKVRAVLAFLLLLGTFYYADTLLTRSEEKLYGENVIYTKTTPYQRIVLTRTKRNFRLYLNNNLQFDSRDEYRYHESLVHPALSMAPVIGRVLVLGGGDGLAVREILKYGPAVQSVTLVDLDDQMTRLFHDNELLRELNADALHDPKVQVINADAYVWLRDYQGEPFDAAIVDFPDPSNYSVGKLYTVHFYQTLRRVLHNHALMAVQTTSPFYAPRSYWCVYSTLQAVFGSVLPYHTYVPSFGEWGFMLASATPPGDAVRQASPLRFYDHHFDRLCYFPADMGRPKGLEINRLDNQILVRYFDEEWSRL
jgi:spermidine synthase